MPEKLTLENAFVEFPEECIVLDEPLFHQTSELAWSALQWLAGKRIGGNYRGGWTAAGAGNWFEMPDDPLRWLLEEVSAQLKQEKEGDDG